LTCGNINGGGANAIAYFDAIGNLSEDATSFGWNDSTKVMSLAVDVLFTNIAVPSTPAAGKVAVYTDSTSKNIAAKDDAGNVTHGIRDASCTNQFISAVSAAGVSTCYTVSFSQVGGSAQCGQLPALTG